MATQSSMDDCYFYYYSSCAKGDECPFRHCEQALGTETVCSLWKEGRCFRNNCKFRHMESRINRSSIPCYWENQPGGCLKPHCVFLHRKLRNGIQYVKPVPRLILPTRDGKTSPKLTETIEETSDPNKSPPKESIPEEVVDYTPDPSSVPVTPLVLNFDEGEESDTESVSSTPVKMLSGNARTNSYGLARNNLSSKFSGADKERDFGIKTLEQIRMEKIHKESDSFYSTDDIAGNISLESNPNPILLKEGFFCHSAYKDLALDAAQAEQLSQEYYPPKSDFLSIPKDSLLEKSLPIPIKETRLGGLDEKSDLRDKISSRRSISASKVATPKRIMNFKKQNKMEENSNSFDFKIKTLEEIRREKKSKQDNGDVSVNILPLDTCPSTEDKCLTYSIKITKKLKITRKTKESNAVSATCMKDTSIGSSIEKVASEMVSNGIQNACEELKQSNKGPVLSNSPGKRKLEFDTSERENKIMKLDSSPDCNQNTSINLVKHEVGNKENEEKYAMKGLQPFLHQSKVLMPHSSPVVPVEINDTTLSNNSISLNGNQDDIMSTTVVSSNTESKTMDELIPKPLTRDTPVKNELNSVKEVKHENINRSMSVDDFERLLNDDDMNIDEIETSPDDDILLEVEQFLDS